MSIPRFLLAAPKSGSGKTFVTCGILRLLKRRVMRVSSFKCGPDFIDPMFHRRVLGVPSRNLDTFFSGTELTRFLFSEGAEDRDISVIEGVMGYFDGTGQDGMLASAYDLSKTLKAPVVLVVEARGMSRSIVPLVKGFYEYGESHNIKGIILNRISKGIYPSMKSWIEAELPVKVLGYLPECRDALWESRHLGLVQPEEIKELLIQVDKVADILEETLDIDNLLSIADSAEALEIGDFPVEKLTAKVKIGIAYDEAFTFYYEDNFNLMRKMGAELKFFSPLRDKAIPDVDGLIFGGGYPELHGDELSQNTEMIGALQALNKKGIPILAECGGFMYLQQGLSDREGRRSAMAGLIPGETQMTERLVRFGYITLKANEGYPSSYLTEGEEIRGHEFHYFDSSDNGGSCRAEKVTGKRGWDCIVSKDNLMAGYPHLYYYSNPNFIRSFLMRCAEWRKQNQ
ncbi:MAG: cobyrinate a,c-diamide synthase [Lachnospiraceae bacterium]|nr:cobyrinate a,c-diamide synthase [Lachnospiraceae bacterium]